MATSITISARIWWDFESAQVLAADDSTHLDLLRDPPAPVEACLRRFRDSLESRKRRQLFPATGAMLAACDEDTSRAKATIWPPRMPGIPPHTSDLDSSSEDCATYDEVRAGKPNQFNSAASRPN